MKGHQAMMRFEKRKQRDDESIDRFLDDLESLRRRSDPEESTNRRNFSIASKFIDGVKSDDLRTMLATYYTLSKDSAPTPEEMRQKSREYMLMKPKKNSYSDNRNGQGASQPQRSSWYKSRDDMDNRRSCANCGSADHHVADCTTYKQGMKSLGYAPDEEDMSQMEEHEFYSGLIIKIGARCFFCNQEGHFRMDCPLFSEAVKNQSHPKHKLAIAAVQNTSNRQAEFETRNSEAPNAELPTKTVKAVTQVNNAMEVNLPYPGQYPIPRIDESLSKLMQGDSKFFTTLDLGSAFWQFPLRKQDRDKTGFACELGLFQWKRMPFDLCNVKTTFQWLMTHALIGVTKKYGNLVICYVDDVVIATPTMEDHIERLDEVFACMKRSGLKCKPSKCEILKDSIKYLGRMVDRHGIKPDPDAVEAVLTWKSPRTEH